MIRLDIIWDEMRWDKWEMQEKGGKEGPHEEKLYNLRRCVKVPCDGSQIFIIDVTWVTCGPSFNSFNSKTL
jgi:hypothetical protein